jgi:hypothetical protein
MDDTILDTAPLISSSDDDPLYERDFLLWLVEQTKLLRANQLEQLDLDHLIEEIEDMGNNLRRELAHRLEVVLMHLLKCQYQPDHKSGSWLRTLNTQRSEIKRLLKQSPSLNGKVMEFARDAHPMARKSAADETGIGRAVFPANIPYSREQLLDEEFVP